MARPAAVRSTDRVVLRVGLAQAGVGFAINSLGACLVLLARDLGRSPEAVAWLAPSFGVGLLAVGVAGPLLLRRGPGRVLPPAASVAAAGAAVLAVASTAAVAACGAVLLGIGAAGVVLTTPALLAGPGAAGRLLRVNAVASVCGVAGPLAVGLLDGRVGSGRLALLLVVPPLLVLAATAVPVARRAAGPGAPRPAPSPPSPSPSPSPQSQSSQSPPPPREPTARASRRRVAAAWSAVVLGVSIEFCFAIWAAARLQETGLEAGAAASAAVAFLVGMAATRFVAPSLIDRGIPVLPLGCALVAVGTLLVALPGAPLPVVAGLVLAGIGTAPFYPVTIARLVAVPGLSVAHGAALGALASGTAITVAPVLLAAVGTALDLRAAFLLAVLPAAAAFALAVRAPRTG